MLQMAVERLVRAARASHDFIGLLNQRTDAGQLPVGEGCQLGLARGSDEQRCAELILKSPDSLRHHRGRDIELARSCGKAATFNDGQEGPHVEQRVHQACMIQCGGVDFTGN